MSGPITPPLTVTTASGTPSGRPITTIKVSDGDLTISGNVATIDTSGGAVTFPLEGTDGSAAAPTYSFSADSDTGMYRIGESIIGFTSNTTRTLSITANYLRLDGPSNPQIINCDGAGNDLELRSGGGTYGKIRIGRENQDIDIQPAGTGQVEVENQTTNSDTTFSVRGNGTGDAKINLNNPTKAVSLICDENQKLKVQGGVNTFILDSSSATGGITWPDGTIQTTASTGGGAPEIGYKTSYYYNPYTNGGSWNGGNTALVADFIYLIPIYINQDVDIDRIAMNVSVAVGSSNIRIGIYNMRDNGLFTTLITSGTATADVTGVKEITVSETLTQGYYWAAVQSDSAISVSYNAANSSMAAGQVRSSGSAFDRFSYARYSVAQAYSGGMPDLTGTNPTDEEWYPFIFNMRVA